ncbi:MAG: hypothetical protein FJZ58_05480, partial [Chlamydiae bacterium]|nr:hypothetical protein [Chlamydiota bacterium]
FQSLLEQVYPDKDIRTEYFGRMLAIGNVLTMSCQFFFTIFCVRIFGMHTCHLLIPLVLMLTQGVFLVVPSINSMAACFLIIKCCDFSFFSVIKEMLYVHMRKEEKFQAKALIDVFGNRASKVISSLIVLTLAPVLSPSFLQPLSWMSLGIFTCWVMLMLSIKTPYQQLAKAP